ncbi:MAG: Dabb family protein [Eubacteriales bacterium]|nr:Dabb family protein [Eubacteriales bacterium]
MYTHVVMWRFKPEIADSEKEELLKNMKTNLESLCGKVPGLLSVKFIEKPLPGTTHEMALVTTHENAEDIKAYGEHPAHLEVANTFVRPYTCDRACLNF